MPRRVPIAGPTVQPRARGIFAVQDELVRTIVAILAAHVRQAEIERPRAKPPNSWQAYDYYLKSGQCI